MPGSRNKYEYQCPHCKNVILKAIPYDTVWCSNCQKSFPTKGKDTLWVAMTRDPKVKP